METSVRLLYPGGGNTHIEVLALYLSDIFLPGSAPGGSHDTLRRTRTLQADRVLLGRMANDLGAIGETGTRRASYSNDATTPSCSCSRTTTEQLDPIPSCKAESGRI